MWVGTLKNNDYQSDYFGGKLKSVANLFTFLATWILQRRIWPTNMAII